MFVSTDKPVYFLSDLHLGAPDYLQSLARERKAVNFLDSVYRNASAIYLLGDLFDFWFEYRHVTPKGYVRLLGKLAEITDAGIPVFFFVGNHDMWMRGYFEKELNIPVFFEPVEVRLNDKVFYIGHGDGLGPDDHGFKMLKKVFRNRFCQSLFGMLHPSLGIGVANFLSRKSRKKSKEADKVFLGEDKEWLVIFSREMLAKKHIDYFIFGHRHYPIDYKLTAQSRYINLGDWISNFTYAVFDGNDITLKKWLD